MDVRISRRQFLASFLPKLRAPWEAVQQSDYPPYYGEPEEKPTPTLSELAKEFHDFKIVTSVFIGAHGHKLDDLESYVYYWLTEPGMGWENQGPT